MNHILTQHLDPVAKRYRWRQVCVTLTVCWLLAAVIGLGMLIANRISGWYSSTMIPSTVVVFAFSTLLGLVYCFRHMMRRHEGYRWIATKIEGRFPDLDSSLMTAIEQQPNEERHYGFLQQEVIRSAVYHDIRHRWANIVPGWQLFAAPASTLLSMLALIGVLFSLFFLVIPPELDPNLTTFGNSVFSGTEMKFSVEPGNTEVEKGKSVLILARFEGRTPPSAVLNYSNAEGQWQQLPMNKSLDDPVFAARIPYVDSAVDYFVQLESQRSDGFRIDVFEYPKLKRADVKLEFPEYAKQESKVVQDFRRVSAVEGTTATLTLLLNKSVRSAQLLSRNGESIRLEPSVDDPAIYLATIQLEKTDRYELQLVDSESRENQVPPRFHFKVLPNSPPKITLVAPGKDIQVSPLEEVQFAAKVWDDFGVVKTGLSFMIPDKAPFDQELAGEVAAKTETVIQHLLELEALGTEPDQLLSYYFWAEDIGPDGKVRRTASDMYFAEVRPFEEIYRQGQQPEGNQQQPSQQQQQQSQQNAQQAGQLAELQKQIINATWKLIRREGVRDEISSEFEADTKAVSDSQASAIQQVETLAQQLTDPKSAEYVKAVIEDMNRAIEQLKQSSADGDLELLDLALRSEQSAYQGLLKLRAREHQVVRNNQQRPNPSQSGQNRQQQQQMQQLQLEQDENRYQSERLAQEQQENNQQREDRQVLNRLRELSRRQNDLNKRVKELQSALENAESEKERKEIEKQLQRLREEQEQILRDAEELGQRMEQPENQQRMSEQSSQLEKAQENIRRANEALEQGEVSRAAAEGTRAERELDELKDEFQKRTAGQFDERMRDMRSKANQLDQRQQEIAKEIDQLNQPNQEDQPKSLRKQDDRKTVRDKIDRQKKDLEDLKKSMRNTIEEAEDVEPLLAQELYDSFRRSSQANPEKALDSTLRSLEQGWNDDAQQQEQKANEGIRDLKRGIEKAAESVLGDESQSLQRANRQLERVKRELENEIRDKDPDALDERQSSDSRSRQNEGDDASDRGDGKSDESKEKKNGGSSGKKQDDSKADKGNKQDGKQSGNGKPSDQKSDGKSDGKQNSKNDDSKNRDSEGKSGGGNPNGNPSDQPRNQDDPNRSNDNNRQPPTPRSLRDPQRGNDRAGQNAPPLNQWGGDDRNLAPLTGQDFLDWSDRLRDVEEMVDDPKLRAEAARIRDRAKAIRKEFQRHSREPNWDLVKMQVLDPLVELQLQIQDELIRKSGKKSIVPIDRDPVPIQFQDAVRKYYQEIGSGK